jgi:hypothetical protein
MGLRRIPPNRIEEKLFPCRIITLPPSPPTPKKEKKKKRKEKNLV